MEDIIGQAKAEFIRAKDRIAHVLETTPDDRISWSPSQTSRTPLHLVAHAAMGTAGIGGMLAGKPFPYKSMEEMDAASRVREKEFTSREQVLGLLDQTSTDYLAWMDGLTPEQVGSTVQMPFGPIPMAAAITFAADHLRAHTAQLDYIQTIYGDHEWHM